MTVKNATRRYNYTNDRDCDDCTVHPKRSSAELRGARQEAKEQLEEAFRVASARKSARVDD